MEQDQITEILEINKEQALVKFEKNEFQHSWIISQNEDENSMIVRKIENNVYTLVPLVGTDMEQGCKTGVSYYCIGRPVNEK